MASEPQNDASPGALPDQLTVNLQVVSPSVGVSRPLMFPGLPAATTIKQLKDRIRQSVSSRPTDENQRLIHRGRAIVRETDSLLDIFGADALKTPDQQTIHLVIRDTHDSHSSSRTSVHGPSPTTTTTTQPANPRQNVQHPFGPQPPPGFTRRTHVQVPTTNPFPPQPRLPSPSPVHTPEQAANFQHHHQNMTQWLNQMQREAMARVINQNQRVRAQMGLRGIGDTPGNAAHTGGDNSGRGSPAPGQTVYREHVGSNGRTYQVETMVRTTGPSTPNGTMSPAQVQGILRGADANEAALAMTNAMQRSTSSTSLHNLQNRSLAQPGVTAPIYPTTTSRRGTPDSVTSQSAGIGGNGATSRSGPEVYILSSPDGPRAILFNGAGATSEAYYTPRLRNQTSYSQLRHSHPSALGNLIYEAQGQVRSRPHHHHHHHHRPHSHPPQIPQQQAQLLQQINPQQNQTSQLQQQQPQQPALQPQPQPQDQSQTRSQAQLRHRQPHQQHDAPQPANGQVQVQDQNQNQNQNPPPLAPMMHHGNPPAAALPPLLMQLWPHIWLVFRLALFVWFFTNPNASWSRWFTILCIAFFIFLISTGVLNGIPDHIWRPLGRHLENLIPMEQPRRARMGDQRDDARGQNEEPNPADMAARLVAEHGADGWFVTQIRRLERAGLLFLASIAPGVAERHIANLEAAARAERERREAERREAEAREAQAREDAENNENGEEGQDGETVDEAEQDDAQLQPEPEGREADGGDLPARENLVAV